MARVSATPGRTQALYWYRVDEAFDIVDCPGYGFARSPRRLRDRLETLIEGVLTEDPRPALALLLVDGRLAPQEPDRSMALFLASAGVPTVVVATKWDAVKPSARERQLRTLAAEYERSDRPLLPVSAETGESLNALIRVVKERIGVLPRGRAPSGASAIPS
jgi:GTP-binding protein